MVFAELRLFEGILDRNKRKNGRNALRRSVVTSGAVRDVITRSGDREPNFSLISWRKATISTN